MISKSVQWQGRSWGAVLLKIGVRIWITLVLIVLGTHFFRSSDYGLVLCVFGILFFFYASKTWHWYAVSLFLVWGALEWGGSAYMLGMMRKQAGFPWIRATFILVMVSFVTLLAGLYMFRQAKNSNANEEAGPAVLQAVAFMVTFCLLLALGQHVFVPLLLLDRYLPIIGSAQVFFMSWYAALVAGWLSDPQKTRIFRKRIWLGFSLVFFGQLGLGLLGMDRMLMTGALHVPIPAFIVWAPVFRGTFSIMPIMAVVAVLLTGSTWCSLLCYFGGFDSWAAGKKNVKPVPAFISGLLKYGRVSVLLVGTCVTFALRLIGISWMTSLLWVLVFAVGSLLVMLLLSKKYNSMLHCTTFCPFGLLVNVTSRLSPWRIKVDKSLCDDCGVCEKFCQYRAITQESRQGGGVLWRCSLCRDCLGFCKQRAIRLHCFGLSNATAMKVFIVLSAVLHVLFISTARV